MSISWYLADNTVNIFCPYRLFTALFHQLKTINFSLETPEFFDDLFLRLTNDETPQNRRLYPFYNSDGAVFWVLTQGR
jgi:hypothetical protein